jgi:hypothetical protein
MEPPNRIKYGRQWCPVYRVVQENQGNQPLIHRLPCKNRRPFDSIFERRLIFLKFTPTERALLGDGAPVDGCYLAWQQDELLLVLTSHMPAVDYEHSFSITCTDPIFSLHMPATNPDMPINDAVEHGIQAFLKENEPPAEDQSGVFTHPDGVETYVEDVRARSRRRRIEVFRTQEPAFRACLNIVINAACFISYRPEEITEEWEGEPLSSF